MKTLELKKKSLEELSKEYGQLTAVEQMECIGGGDGTFTNPWTYEQYNADYTCYGGYVDFCGQVIYVIPAAVCNASYSNKLSSPAALVFDSVYEGIGHYFEKVYQGSFRITNSKSEFELVIYNKVVGNQYCNTSKHFFEGKVITGKTFSKCLGALGIGMSLYDLYKDAKGIFDADSIEEMTLAIVDTTADCICLVPHYGIGIAFSIYWNGFDGRSQVLNLLGL